MMDWGDREEWYLLLIRAWSDIQQWRKYDSGLWIDICRKGHWEIKSTGTRMRTMCRHSCFSCGLNNRLAQGHNQALQITHGSQAKWESPSAVRGVTTHPACRNTTTRCCCFLNLPQLLWGSSWVAAVHCLALSRPRWLVFLPAGWVALMPGSHLNPKCVFIWLPVLV